VTLGIGIDIGATKIAAGLVDVATGQVLTREESPTRPERGSRAVLKSCVDIASRLGGPRPVPVGVAVCEVVGPDGRLRSASTIDWREVDVPAGFEAVGPCVMESDVRAAALGEARFGHGRGVPSFLLVVAGTGLSCSLVDGGHPRTGRDGRAILLGPPTLEESSSGGALMRRLGTPDLRAVIEDPARRSIVEAAAAQVGAYIAVLVNALDFGLVVLAGGLGNNERYRSWVRAAVDADLWPGARPVRFEGSALGADGGVIGAALTAMEAQWAPAWPHEGATA